MSETKDLTEGEKPDIVLNLSVKESGLVQTIPRAGYIQEGDSLSIKFNPGDFLILYYRKI